MVSDSIVDFAKFVNGTEKLTEKQTGLHAVRPLRADGTREDGFVNLLTNYGTSRDSSEHYKFQGEDPVMDDELEQFYEGNGLFARIIDLPAEEAIKKGFEIKDLADGKVKDFYMDCLDELDWEEKFMTALKWARLFGGSLAVLLVDDGRGLDEPLDWSKIKSVDDIRVYDRSVVSLNYASINQYEGEDPFRVRGSRLGFSDKYMVASVYGTFTVHDSRCLVFQNGVLPERSTNSIYRYWGLPEYIRIKRAVKDAEISHGMGPKMLDRSIQAVYKMQNLAMEMATEDGEKNILKRLQIIDLARGLLNSIVLDAEGEDYDFKSFSFSGVSDVINTSCNWLSAITGIPQTILFGRSPAGMNATGASDLENYYNYVERMQKRMVKSNLRYLLAVLTKAGLHSKEIDEVPSLKIEFNSLWSQTEQEKVALDLQKAQVAQTNANTANVYVTMGAIDPTEVRNKLADDGDFTIDTMLDDYTEEELEENNPANKQQQDPMAAMMGMMGGGGQEGPEQPQMQPQEQGMPEGDKDTAEPPKAPVEEKNEEIKEDEEEPPKKSGVGVIVVKDGKVLTGTRLAGRGVGLLCGPGGHVEEGETPAEAAMRETMEEFHIKPMKLMKLGTKLETGDGIKTSKDDAEHLRSTIYLCTDFEGEPECDGLEMAAPQWRDMEDLGLMDDRLFKPFADSLKMLKKKAKQGLMANRESWDGK